MPRKDPLEAGTVEHYLDAALYDHEYKRRRKDVAWYRALAGRYGGPILELGCGTGRILAALARDGHEVVGVDASRTMLERCRKRAPGVDLIEGDFRKISLGRKFPLVICAFNTFMHLYDRIDVERALSTVRAHLVPGGVFAFDVMNPDLRWLSRDPLRRWARTRFRHPTTGERMIYTTSLSYDGARQLAFMEIYYAPEHGSRRQKKKETRVRLLHRHFFPREIESLLHYNGFVVVEHLGDFDGDLAPESDQQALVCRVNSSSRK